MADVMMVHQPRSFCSISSIGIVSVENEFVGTAFLCATCRDVSSPGISCRDLYSSFYKTSTSIPCKSLSLLGKLLLHLPSIDIESAVISCSFFWWVEVDFLVLWGNWYNSQSQICKRKPRRFSKNILLHTDPVFSPGNRDSASSNTTINLSFLHRFFFFLYWLRIASSSAVFAHILRNIVGNSSPSDTELWFSTAVARCHISWFLKLFSEFIPLLFRAALPSWTLNMESCIIAHGKSQTQSDCDSRTTFPSGPVYSDFS